MEIQRIIDGCVSWMKKEITYSRIGEYFEITLPYTDNAGDYIQIYVRQEGSSFIITDDGALLQNMQLTEDLKRNLQDLLNRYGIKMNDEELVAESRIDVFPQQMHQYIEAVLKINSISAVENETA